MKSKLNSHFKVHMTENQINSEEKGVSVKKIMLFCNDKTLFPETYTSLKNILKTKGIQLGVFQIPKDLISVEGFMGLNSLQSGEENYTDEG